MNNHGNLRQHGCPLITGGMPKPWTSRHTFGRLIAISPENGAILCADHYRSPFFRAAHPTTVGPFATTELRFSRLYMPPRKTCKIADQLVTGATNLSVLPHPWISVPRHLLQRPSPGILREAFHGTRCKTQAILMPYGTTKGQVGRSGHWKRPTVRWRGKNGSKFDKSCVPRGRNKPLHHLGVGKRKISSHRGILMTCIRRQGS